MSCLSSFVYEKIDIPKVVSILQKLLNTLKKRLLPVSRQTWDTDFLVPKIIAVRNWHIFAP